MIMRKSLVITLAAILVSLILTSCSSAQDTLLISYQGRLTDDGGNPITGPQAMTFTIYDGAGASKWTESHPAVQVSEGLFNVILGSQSALPDSVFTGEDRYLGITVSGDPEISPRTLFTSTSSAAVAKKVAGDITTGEGEMILRSSTGADSAIVFSANGTAHLMKINWSIPPDDIRPGLELGSDANSNFMRVNWAIPPDDQVPAFEVLSDAINEKIEMRLGMPPDDQMPEVGFRVDQTVTAFNMNSPTGGLNPDFQIQASATSGTSMYFFDDVRKKMGVEPSPFNEGFGLKLYDPTQVSETELIAMSGFYGDSIMARFQMFHPLASTPSASQIDLITTETNSSFKLGNISTEAGTSGIIMNASDNSASIALGCGPGAPNSVITISTDATEARVGIGTDSPSALLTVGDDLTTFSSNILTVGDADISHAPGISFGQNADNRGWMAYDNDGDYVYLGTKENGTFYNWAFTFKEGQCGIGTNAPNYDLDVRGTIGNNTTLYHSDKRWKQDIRDLDGSLDKVMKLQGVQYKWRQNEYPEMNFPDGEQIGLIAQDVEQIIPEVVNESTDGYKSLDYAKLVSVLIESIKEQQEQIDRQQDHIEALSKRVDELEGMEISSK